MKLTRRYWPHVHNGASQPGFRGVMAQESVLID